MIVCHVDRGGAYRVAKMYAEYFELPLYVNPSYWALLSFLFFYNSKKLIIFHAPHSAVKYAWLVRAFSPRTKIYCVEHFVLTQVLKYEFSSLFRRKIFLVYLFLNELLGVRPICLDEYCEKVRRRLVGKVKAKVVYNLIEEGGASNSPNHQYDIVWAAGLSFQKKWPAVLEKLVEIKSQRPALKIAIVSYDSPSDFEMDVMYASGIEYRYDDKRWMSLAPIFFFSSNYEGFPLALGEAIVNDMHIIAWCQRSCATQILKYGSSYNWFSSVSDINIQQVLNSINEVKVVRSSRSLLDRYSKETIYKQLDGLWLD